MRCVPVWKRVLRQRVFLDLRVTRPRDFCPGTGQVGHQSAKQKFECPSAVELRILPNLVPHALARLSEMHDVPDPVNRHMSMFSIPLVSVLMDPDVDDVDVTVSEKRGYDGPVDVLWQRRRLESRLLGVADVHVHRVARIWAGAGSYIDNPSELVRE